MASNTLQVSGADITRGAISSAAVAGIINYNKLKKNEVTKEEAVKNSLKIGIQGGIATGAAISATNSYAANNLFGMLTALSIGAAGIYAVEKINDTLEARATTQEIEVIE